MKMIRRHSILKFGKTGGEDTFFFRELRKRGCHMIWCREALVFGPISPAKANLRWILKRRFRTGNNYPRFYKRSDKVKMKKILKSIKAIVISSGVALLYLWRSFSTGLTAAKVWSACFPSFITPESWPIMQAFDMKNTAEVRWFRSCWAPSLIADVCLKRALIYCCCSPDCDGFCFLI